MKTHTQTSRKPQFLSFRHEPIFIPNGTKPARSSPLCPRVDSGTSGVMSLRSSIDGIPSFQNLKRYVTVHQGKAHCPLKQ